jgi:hypothetical protein
MNRAFRPEPEAAAELEDAVVWYDTQRPGLGLEFVQAVDVALERIARWPEIGRAGSRRPEGRARPQVPGHSLPVPHRIHGMGWSDPSAGLRPR